MVTCDDLEEMTNLNNLLEMEFEIKDLGSILVLKFQDSKVS